jgi:hypothetical protein
MTRSTTIPQSPSRWAGEGAAIAIVANGYALRNHSDSNTSDDRAVGSTDRMPTTQRNAGLILPW